MMTTRCRYYRLALCFIAAVGCSESPPTVEEFHADDESETEDGATTGHHGEESIETRYYRATSFSGRCPEPAFPCSGISLVGLHLDEIECADGSIQDECTIAAVDFAGLGYSKSDTVLIDEQLAVGDIVLHGALYLAPSPSALEPGPSAMALKEVWSLLQDGTSSPLEYSRVKSLGIECVLWPCENMEKVVLGSDSVTAIADLDVSELNLSAEEHELIEAAVHGDGVLVGGEDVEIEGPAGTAIGIRTSEIYHRLMPAAGEQAAIVYSVTPDHRDCAAPACGGYFLTAINRPYTSCGDDLLASDCYVSFLDLHGLSLDDTKLKLLQAQLDSGQALLEGALAGLSISSSEDFPILTAERAWLSGESKVATWAGLYSFIWPTGLECVAYPCSNIFRSSVNLPTEDFVAELDFDGLSLSPEQNDEVESAFGDGRLIVIGTGYEIFGPGGEGVAIKVGGYFIEIVSP